jgi:phage baseplate assembly protein W
VALTTTKPAEPPKPTTTHHPPAAHQGAIPPPASSPPPPPEKHQPGEAAQPVVLPFGCYADEDDVRREVVIYERPDQGALVIDRNNETHDNARLVGELARDEPDINAALLAQMWLECPLEQRRAAPYSGTLPQQLPAQLDTADGTYRIAVVSRGERIGSDLRWVCQHPGSDKVATTLREVVAALEAYEPAVAMTEAAIATIPDDTDGGHSVLAREIARLRGSRRVLNRRLREAILAEVAHGTSLAEIAARCGRVEIAANGVVKGESSWVARRVGLAGDGHGAPRRWIDVDVLAQIADAISLTAADVEL